MNRPSLVSLLSCSTAALVCLLACSCSVAPDVSGVISGHVYSADSYQPLSGAVVECDDIHVTTDSDGYYYLGGITAGFRTLTSTASGFETYYEVLNVRGAVAHDIYMETYVPLTTLSGFVSHSYYGPIERAVVQVDGRSDTTDQSGFYSIARIPQGFRDVEVAADGYRGVTVHLGLSESEETYSTELKIYATAELGSSRDATIREHMIDVNFGALNTIEVFNNGGFFHDKSYIAFDWDLPASTDVVAATIHLYDVSALGGRDDPPELIVSRVAEQWGEYKVTWRDSLDCHVADACSPEYENGWLLIDATDLFGDWIDFGAANHGVCVDAVTDPLAEVLELASREYEEADKRPHVVLEYAW